MRFAEDAPLQISLQNGQHRNQQRRMTAVFTGINSIVEVIERELFFLSIVRVNCVIYMAYFSSTRSVAGLSRLTYHPTYFSRRSTLALRRHHLTRENAPSRLSVHFLLGPSLPNHTQPCRHSFLSVIDVDMPFLNHSFDFRYIDQ